MTPEPKSRGRARPARQELIQDRPAARAQKRPVLDPDNRDGDFPPNPEPGQRAGRPEPSTRHLKVVGPKEVGGVLAPGWLSMELTDSQLEALIAGGHVEDWDGVEGWGKDPEPDPEPEAEPADTPKDGPKAGADKEGS
jgi:hypothetical protein